MIQALGGEGGMVPGQSVNIYIKARGALVLQLVYHPRPRSSKKHPRQGFYFGVK